MEIENLVPAPRGRLLVKRDGSSITRQIPKPIVVVDTREQAPFDFTQLGNWIAGTKWQKLDVGDYSVVGMERLLRLERNPNRNPKKPCMYVGMTGLKPEERFANHKQGIKSASAVKRYGIRLLPELYAHLNPCPLRQQRRWSRIWRRICAGTGTRSRGTLACRV